MGVERSNLFFSGLITKVSGGEFIGIEFRPVVLNEVDSEKSAPQPAPVFLAF